MSALQNNNKILPILWVAFVMAFFMHAGLILSGIVEPIESMATIPTLLWPLAAGVTSIGGFFIYRSIYNGKVDEVVRSGSEDAKQEKAVQFFVPHLIAWVVNESGSICGLLSYMTTGDTTLALSIVAVSLFVHLCMRPKLDAWSATMPRHTL